MGHGRDPRRRRGMFLGPKFSLAGGENLNAQLGFAGALALNQGVGSVYPVAGLTTTFDYVPARDGLQLLTGGPTLSGYAADKAAHPARMFMPRTDDNVYAAKGCSDTSSGNYQYNADPEYTWSNAYSPFAIDGSGNLRIRAQTVASVSPGFSGGEIPNNPNGGSPYTYISGVLSTEAWFSQAGGYFEINAKLPHGKATWPAFWLIPLNRAHPPEIDVMEYIDISANTTNLVNVITAGSVGHSQSVVAAVDLSADFHRYGVYFDDTTATFYLDGIAVKTQALSTFPETGVPYAMLIANQIGSTIGGWVSAPDGTTPTPADMLIKWVRAAQRQGPVTLNLSASSYLDSANVGDTLATISATNFGGNSSYTYSIVSDPDSMFSITGSSLKLAQVVLATTAASHSVTLKVTDSAGKSYTRNFTIAVITATPIQSNYITTSDPSNAFWTKQNGTGTTPDTIKETAVSGTHGFYKNSIVRAAAVKTFTVWAEIDPVLGRDHVLLQLQSGFFGSDGALAHFDLTNKSVDFSSVSGNWSAIVPFVTPIPGGTKIRVGFDFTTDGVGTGFTVQLLIESAAITTSYLGDITKGLKVSNMWLFNKNAGAGGS